MAKFIDRLAATFIVFLICCTAGFFLTRNLAGAAAIAFCLSLCFNLALQNINRKSNDKNCTQDAFFYHILKGGAPLFFEYAEKLLSEDAIKKRDANALLVTAGGKTQAVFCGYKSSAAGVDDVFRFYKTAKDAGASKAYVFCRAADRKAVSAAAFTDIEFQFVSHKQFYAMLKKRKLLPILEKRGKRASIREALKTLFSRRHALPFMLSGGSLALCSLILPKAAAIYYISVGCVCLGLALVCLFDLSGKCEADIFKENRDEKD